MGALNNMRMGLRGEHGFTMVELMVVVLILGVMVLIVVPVYITATANAARRVCFQNQNTLERATELYLAINSTNSRADLQGTVDSDHPIVVNQIVGTPPRCPAGDKPSNPKNPTIAEGAYAFDAGGSIVGCTRGLPIPHGYFAD